MSEAQWWDEFRENVTGSIDPPNLSRILVGQTIVVAVDGDEHPVTIDRVGRVDVGIDSSGIFAAIHVFDGEPAEWVLYDDGSIGDADDNFVGKHSIKLGPAVPA